jgi:hypothetical protein
MAKNTALAVFVTIFACSCSPRIDGVLSVGVPTLDPRLTERNATNAAWTMIRTDNFQPYELQLLEKTNTSANMEERFLQRDPKNPNRGFIRLAIQGKPANVKIEMKDTTWLTATLEDWP